MEIVGREGAMISQLLSAASLRARVHAENLANQSVPGFKRRVVEFESLVARAIERGADASHIEPRIEVDLVTPSTPDGNNVNLDLETAAMRESWLSYQLYAQALESRLSSVRAAITEGRG